MSPRLHWRVLLVSITDLSRYRTKQTLEFDKTVVTIFSTSVICQNRNFDACFTDVIRVILISISARRGCQHSMCIPFHFTNFKKKVVFKMAVFCVRYMVSLPMNLFNCYLLFKGFQKYHILVVLLVTDIY